MPPDPKSPAPAMPSQGWLQRLLGWLTRPADLTWSGDLNSWVAPRPGGNACISWQGLWRQNKYGVWVIHGSVGNHLSAQNEHPDDVSARLKQMGERITERDLRILALELEQEATRKALSEIHILAHCTAKAGPLHTPSLEVAWTKFLRISRMATSGLATSWKANLQGSDEAPGAPSYGARHELKTWPEFFNAIAAGQKTFEIRKNDRNYHPGDVLVLREYLPAEDAFTGRQLEVLVTYITAFQQSPDYVVMAIKRFSRDASPA